MADRQVDRGLRRGGRRLIDVAVVGGGIAGCAAAALLAERGARVELFERERLAAAASGRNSGSVQHPFDPVLAELHRESLELYRSLEGFSLPERPAGVLMLARDRAAVEAAAAEAADLGPEIVEGEELRALEPALAPGLAACRLETGYPVRPAAATLAFASLARARGVEIREGAAARPWIGGVEVGGERVPAGAVVVAAGPWTPALVDPGWRPIAPVWGAVVEIELDDPPRHVLEEVGVEELAGGAGGPIFSLVTAEGVPVLGSTFLADEPDAAALAPALAERGAAFVPALRDARRGAHRTCPRPQSLDGRPLIGRVADGLWVHAGHGPWGISTAPASARILADALLAGRPVPPALDAARFERSPAARDG